MALLVVLLRKFLKRLQEKGWDYGFLSRVRLSVTCIFSYTFSPRVLKIGRNNPHGEGSKSVDQIFEILSRS